MSEGSNSRLWGQVIQGIFLLVVVVLVLLTLLYIFNRTIFFADETVEESDNKKSQISK